MQEQMPVVQQLNEELKQQAAIRRCDKCPEPKLESLRELELPNSVRISLDCYRCQSPPVDCTAEVQLHLLSESVEVANPIMEWMAEQPKLKSLGVTWWTCGEPRHVLSFPTPAEASVVAALGAIAIEVFRVKE